MILLNPQIFDLFVQQRTNNTFKNTTRGSRKIRKHMFREAAPTEVTQWNPVLESSFFRPKAGDYILSSHSCRRDETLRRFFEFCPSLGSEIYEPAMPLYKAGTCCRQELYRKRYQGGLQLVHVLPLHKDIKETWHDMLIVQSPRKCSHFDVTDSGEWIRKLSIENSKTVNTLGNIFTRLVYYDRFSRSLRDRPDGPYVGEARRLWKW